MMYSAPGWAGRRIARISALAILSACPLLTQAQSAVSPFGAVSSGTINAISQWENLPEAVRTDLEAQLAPLSEADRQALLSTVPSLRNLDAAGINTILATVALDVPVPSSTIAAFAPDLAGLNFASSQVRLHQTFVAEQTGYVGRIEVLMSHPYPGTGDTFVFASVRAGDTSQVPPPRQLSSSPALAAVQVPSTSAAEPTWIGADFPIHEWASPVQLIAGQTYTLTLDAPSRGGNSIYGQPPMPGNWHGVTGQDLYTPGAGYEWYVSEPIGGDFAFKIFLKQ